MSNLPTAYFNSIDELETYVSTTQPASILVGYYPVEHYAGMALAILLDFKRGDERCYLRLEWMALGLDLYGDTLQEFYVYAFNTLEEVVEYLATVYQIGIGKIPKSYQFDSSQHPNPICHSTQKEAFEEAWSRFQRDFKAYRFLNDKLILVSSSQRKA